MPLALPSLCLAALVAADAPPRTPCDGTPWSAIAPDTPVPPPPARPPEWQPDWCPPDFTPLEPEEGDPVPRRPGERTWVDSAHAFIEANVFRPVRWVDRFFSDERSLEDERAHSFIGWRNELRLDVESHPAFATTVRANLRFPGLNLVLRRLRIVVEGSTRDALGNLFPEEQSGPAGRRARGGNAELRLDLWRALGARADLGAGLLFGWPPGAYGRARLRWRAVLFDHVVYRSALAGFWRTDTRFGTSFEAHLERPFALASPVVARLGSTLDLTQESRGLEWTPDATVVVGLGPRAAIALGASAQWWSRPEPGRPRLDRTRLGVRLRRDFYRRWLFLELEPEFYWPWSPERGRHPAWATTFRVEVQFHGTAPPPRPEASPEDDPDEAARDVAPPSGRR